MTDHVPHIEPYVGSVSSFYIASCSCGWTGSDNRERSQAEDEFKEHAAGNRPPWIMEPGEVPGWEVGKAKRHLNG